MKPMQLSVPLATGIVGIAIGLALAPAIRKPEAGDPDQAAMEQNRRPASNPTGADSGTPSGSSNSRTRVRTRKDSKKPAEARVSIPLDTLVAVLKRGNLEYSSEFDSLERSLPDALRLLGASEQAQEEIVQLVKASVTEVLFLERKHLKVKEVTEDGIRMDMGGMEGPVNGIIGKTKDGIRNALPTDLAESLIEAINWEDYYPTKPDSFLRLEVTYDLRGNMTAWEKSESGGSGSGIGGKYKNDGTPLPAEELFGERWKPYLEGVMIMPKEEE